MYIASYLNWIEIVSLMSSIFYENMTFLRFSCDFIVKKYRNCFRVSIKLCRFYRSPVLIIIPERIIELEELSDLI